MSLTYVPLVQYKPQIVVELLRLIGKCPKGWDWMLQADGSYVCEGGQHRVTQAELLEGLAERDHRRAVVDREPGSVRVADFSSSSSRYVKDDDDNNSCCCCCCFS